MTIPSSKPIEQRIRQLEKQAKGAQELACKLFNSPMSFQDGEVSSDLITKALDQFALADKLQRKAETLKLEQHNGQNRLPNLQYLDKEVSYNSAGRKGYFNGSSPVLFNYNIPNNIVPAETAVIATLTVRDQQGNKKFQTKVPGLAAGNQQFLWSGELQDLKQQTLAHNYLAVPGEYSLEVDISYVIDGQEQIKENICDHSGIVSKLEQDYLIIDNKKILLRDIKAVSNRDYAQQQKITQYANLVGKFVEIENQAGRIQAIKVDNSNKMPLIELAGSNREYPLNSISKISSAIESGTRAHFKYLDPSRPITFAFTPNPLAHGLRYNNIMAKVYDANNQLVRTITASAAELLNKVITWDGKDDSGMMVPLARQYSCKVIAELYDEHNNLLDEDNLITQVRI